LARRAGGGYFLNVSSGHQKVTVRAKYRENREPAANFFGAKEM
jgi:hypothetical protein